MLLDDLRTRIAAQVDELPAERLAFAAELAELVRQDALPNAALSGYLIDAGTRGIDGGVSSAGAFIQNVEQTISAVLVFNSAGDVTGGKAVARADDVVSRFVLAVAGWSPPAETGRLYRTDFRLVATQVGSLVRGRVIYELDFAIGLQLRITL